MFKWGGGDILKVSDELEKLMESVDKIVKRSKEIKLEQLKLTYEMEKIIQKLDNIERGILK